MERKKKYVSFFLGGGGYLQIKYIKPKLVECSSICPILVISVKAVPRQYFVGFFFFRTAISLFHHYVILLCTNNRIRITNYNNKNTENQKEKKLPNLMALYSTI